MRYTLPTSEYVVTYRAQDREEDLTIQARVYAPPNFSKIEYPMIELEDGLYYVVLNFTVEGNYIVDILDFTETYKVSRSFR